jgi:alcohol dehydrogenase
LVPTLALLDPELTLTVPPQITAMTGMDAMTHAVEAITSVQANPMSEALALKAIELLRQNLLDTVRDGGDLGRRGSLMAAANMAGIAFDHAMVGVVHAMSHATGGVAHVPHGMANSIYLPYGMEYNLEVAAASYARMAPAFGLKASGDEEADARAVIQAVRDLRRELNQACGLPQSLREAGVQEADLAEIARNAAEDGTSFFNPREVTEEEVLAKIREAY